MVAKMAALTLAHMKGMYNLKHYVTTMGNLKMRLIPDWNFRCALQSYFGGHNVTKNILH